MKQVDRTKVCWSCEADVSFDATYCPFCGTDLLTSTVESKEAEPKQDDRFEKQSLEESLASLYKPPYSVRNKQGLGVPDEREEPTFKQVTPPKENPLFTTYETETSDDTPSKTEITEEEPAEKQGGVLPLLLLTIGLHLIVLGFLVLFFSREGVVHLEWKGSSWILYLLLGLPTTYFGIRMLKRLA